MATKLVGKRISFTQEISLLGVDSRLYVIIQFIHFEMLQSELK